MRPAHRIALAIALQRTIRKHPATRSAVESSVIVRRVRERV